MLKERIVMILLYALFGLLLVIAFISESAANDVKQYSIATNCMALNIYHEARGEPIEGQFAVAFVTMTRSKQRKLDVCGVVFQKAQFSWTREARDSKGRLTPDWVPHGKHWEYSKNIARLTMSGLVKDFTNGTDHFFGTSIKPPKWSHNMHFMGKIGGHVFYASELPKSIPLENLVSAKLDLKQKLFYPIVKIMKATYAPASDTKGAKRSGGEIKVSGILMVTAYDAHRQIRISWGLTQTHRGTEDAIAKDHALSLVT